MLVSDKVSQMLSTLRSSPPTERGFGELVAKLERGLLYRRTVKAQSENNGRIRRRKSPDAVNSKLIMAAVRLWELKRRNPSR
jgi:hypothetical protein